MVVFTYIVSFLSQGKKELPLKCTDYRQTMNDTQTWRRWRCDNYTLCVHKTNGYTFYFFLGGGGGAEKNNFSTKHKRLKLFAMHLNSMSLSWKISGNDFSVWKYLNARKNSTITKCLFFKVQLRFEFYGRSLRRIKSKFRNSLSY